MVAQFIAALERPVSRVRLENYRRGGDDLAMVTNYFYNLELSESLYPSLQAFEIALRNSLHLTLTRHFQNNPFWFDEPNFLPAWQTREIQGARDTLTKEGKPHDADRIIAELKLGFWHSLFNSPFEGNLWRPNKSAKVLEVFPQISGKQRNRQSVWDRIERLRILRNRVMHWEPVWSRPHIAQDHFLILETIRWISQEMHETIAMCDRFPVVLQKGRVDVQIRIQAEIQRRYPTTTTTPPPTKPFTN